MQIGSTQRYSQVLQDADRGSGSIRSQVEGTSHMKKSSVFSRTQRSFQNKTRGSIYYLIISCPKITTYGGSSMNQRSQKMTDDLPIEVDYRTNDIQKRQETIPRTGPWRTDASTTLYNVCLSSVRIKSRSARQPTPTTTTTNNNNASTHHHRNEFNQPPTRRRRRIIVAIIHQGLHQAVRRYIIEQRYLQQHQP